MLASSQPRPTLANVKVEILESRLKNRSHLQPQPKPAQTHESTSNSILSTTSNSSIVAGQAQKHHSQQPQVIIGQKRLLDSELHQGSLHQEMSMPLNQDMSQSQQTSIDENEPLKEVHKAQSSSSFSPSSLSSISSSTSSLSSISSSTSSLFSSSSPKKKTRRTRRHHTYTLEEETYIADQLSIPRNWVLFPINADNMLSNYNDTNTIVNVDTDVGVRANIFANSNEYKKCLRREILGSFNQRFGLELRHRQLTSKIANMTRQWEVANKAFSTFGVSCKPKVLEVCHYFDIIYPALSSSAANLMSSGNNEENTPTAAATITTANANANTNNKNESESNNNTSDKGTDKVPSLVPIGSDQLPSKRPRLSLENSSTEPTQASPLRPRLLQACVPIDIEWQKQLAEKQLNMDEKRLELLRQVLDFDKRMKEIQEQTLVAILQRAQAETKRVEIEVQKVQAEAYKAQTEARVAQAEEELRMTKIVTKMTEMKTIGSGSVFNHVNHDTSNKNFKT
ncbi:hypothetical protein BGZ46_007799 [Entomortierella lignicola]|nr:hypothetical protein BGZ46_007799 [Entomortierella lignicola]